MDPLVVAAVAGPVAICVCWISWLVFAYVMHRRGATLAQIAQVAKAFWRWISWKV